MKPVQCAGKLCETTYVKLKMIRFKQLAMATTTSINRIKWYEETVMRCMFFDWLGMCHVEANGEERAKK